MIVHQLIPSFVSGDATGQAALHFQLLLRRLGHFGEIYAGEVEPKLATLARPLSALRPASQELVLYHHGIASPLCARLMHLDCRRALVYHNITPARFYPGSALADALVKGRAQLAAMAPFTELSIGVSEYNAGELREAGHRNVQVVPLFVEPSRFTSEFADKALQERLGQVGPAVLTVSRVVPHKRMEDLLSLHAELLRLRPDARLWVVGGYEPGGRYFRDLSRRAQRLPGVSFLGRVSHAELVAAYRASRVFVSMSEHEGFGVPLIEAMAAEVPVVAYGAAAVPETLGGAGIGFSEKRFAFLAELLHELLEDGPLRRRVLKGQARRVAELGAEPAMGRLKAALESIGVARPKLSKTKRRRPKVGLVVQRYGEVSGGAELHARMVAERLSPHWDLTVLTTCSRDHLAWDNDFPEGLERDGPIAVRRFASRRGREMGRFNALSRERFGRPNDRLHEEHWVAEQGPVPPGLFRHLAEQGHRYDGFVFFTYLYAPTVCGLPLVAERSLLVPTAHDEPPFAFGVYADVFERPKALLCNTPEEAALIRRRFPGCARTRVVGVGIDEKPADAEAFRQRHGIERPYLLYVGRLEPGKGIPELLAHYRRLRGELSDPPDLVLAGTAAMKLAGAGVRALGRISEEDKEGALAGALGVVVPSRYESLSLLTLEAWAQGTPVLVNGESEVLVGQVRRSGAGASYRSAEEFTRGVEALGRERARLSKRGRAFAQRHSWERVVSVYLEEMERR
jgi:glycosyltransferase involved in cell wall biosynthesis